MTRHASHFAPCLSRSRLSGLDVRLINLLVAGDDQMEAFSKRLTSSADVSVILTPRIGKKYNHSFVPSNSGLTVLDFCNFDRLRLYA